MGEYYPGEITIGGKVPAALLEEFLREATSTGASRGRLRGGGLRCRDRRGVAQGPRRGRAPATGGRPGELRAVRGVGGVLLFGTASPSTAIATHIMNSTVRPMYPGRSSNMGRLGKP